MLSDSWDDNQRDVLSMEEFVPETQGLIPLDLLVENKDMFPSSPSAVQNPSTSARRESFPYLKVSNYDLVKEVEKPQNDASKEVIRPRK
ncbi:Histidinol-phosphate aminotransferase [Bienertia sinuspersici]